MISWTQEQSFRAGVWHAAKLLDQSGHHELADKLRYPEDLWSERTINFDERNENEQKKDLR